MPDALGKREAKKKKGTESKRLQEERSVTK